jgi:hypothetical protein
LRKELNEVIPNLKAARTNEYGRLDKAMAQMILAKMYLNAHVFGTYTECMLCADVIAGGLCFKTNYLDNSRQITILLLR